MVATHTQQQTKSTEDATSARSDLAFRVPRPSAQPTNPATFVREHLEKVWWQREGEQEDDQGEESESESRTGLFRIQRPQKRQVTSSRTTTVVVQTSTSLNGSSSTTASASPTSNLTTSSAPGTTQLAEFSAGGLVWTITSLNGIEAVQGKTISPGAQVNIAGEWVSEGPSGIVAGGERVTFTTYTAPSSSSDASGPRSSAAVASSSAAGASLSGAAAASGGAVAMQTAGVGVVAVVGAMVL